MHAIMSRCRDVRGLRLAGLLLAMMVMPMMLSGWARADMGLMLNEALGMGASRWTGAGHAAIYLSNICAASPVTVRPCEPGENGVVLTNYRNFGEDRSYRWNAIPLNIYLYGGGGRAGAGALRHADGALDSAGTLP